MSKVTGIILAAGDSARYGKSINKNFDKIDNRSVLNYSLEVFDKSDYIDDIVLVFKKEELKSVYEILSRSNLTKPMKMITGGKTRQESVFRGLTYTDSDYVVIHDGARPLIKEKYIEDCLSTMKQYDGCSVGVKASDTIKITDEDGLVIDTTKRSNTWIVQTPQCFNRKVLLDCHKKHLCDTDNTDDCMLLEKDGYKVKMIEGDRSNIKITTQDDLWIVKDYIRKNNRPGIKVYKKDLF